jgi:hypothetical protein
MMSSRDDYRNKAVDCLTLAEAMRNIEERATMLQMAQGYLKLAGIVGKRHEGGAAQHGDGCPDVP